MLKGFKIALSLIGIALLTAYGVSTAWAAIPKSTSKSNLSAKSDNKLIRVMSWPVGDGSTVAVLYKHPRHTVLSDLNCQDEDETYIKIQSKKYEFTTTAGCDTAKEMARIATEMCPMILEVNTKTNKIRNSYLECDELKFL